MSGCREERVNLSHNLKCASLVRKQLYHHGLGTAGCISFAVMEDEGLTGALTRDHHFEQAGFKALLAWRHPGPRETPTLRNNLRKSA
jgi:hypothetical protein